MDDQTRIFELENQIIEIEQSLPRNFKSFLVKFPDYINTELQQLYSALITQSRYLELYDRQHFKLDAFPSKVEDLILKRSPLLKFSPDDQDLIRACLWNLFQFDITNEFKSELIESIINLKLESREPPEIKQVFSFYVFSEMFSYFICDEFKEPAINLIHTIAQLSSTQVPSELPSELASSILRFSAPIFSLLLKFNDFCLTSLDSSENLNPNEFIDKSFKSIAHSFRHAPILTSSERALFQPKLFKYELKTFFDDVIKPLFSLVYHSPGVQAFNEYIIMKKYIQLFKDLEEKMRFVSFENYAQKLFKCFEDEFKEHTDYITDNFSPIDVPSIKLAPFDFNHSVFMPIISRRVIQYFCPSIQLNQNGNNNNINNNRFSKGSNEVTSDISSAGNQNPEVLNFFALDKAFNFTIVPNCLEHKSTYDNENPLIDPVQFFRSQNKSPYLIKYYHEKQRISEERSIDIKNVIMADQNIPRKLSLLEMHKKFLKHQKKSLKALKEHMNVLQLIKNLTQNFEQQATLAQIQYFSFLATTRNKGKIITLKTKKDTFNDRLKKCIDDLNICNDDHPNICNDDLNKCNDNHPNKCIQQISPLEIRFIHSGLSLLYSNLLLFQFNLNLKESPKFLQILEKFKILGYYLDNSNPSEDPIKSAKYIYALNTLAKYININRKINPQTVKIPLQKIKIIQPIINNQNQCQTFWPDLFEIFSQLK